MNVWITGGAGFIGSALARQLNINGIKDIVIIDDLTNGEKFSNLKKIEYLEQTKKKRIELSKNAMEAIKNRENWQQRVDTIINDLSIINKGK